MTRWDNIEPKLESDKLAIVRIREKDWDALIGRGLELPPPPARLQLVMQPGETAGGLLTYGVRIVSR